MLTRSGQHHGYVGHPVDIWSTGVTLFAMLCGYLPFEHANTASLYKKIIAGEFMMPPFLSREARTTSLTQTLPERVASSAAAMVACASTPITPASSFSRGVGPS